MSRGSGGMAFRGGECSRALAAVVSRVGGGGRAYSSGDLLFQAGGDQRDREAVKAGDWLADRESGAGSDG